VAITSGRGTRTETISCPWPQANLTMGNFCSIGHNCQIFLGGNHRSDWASQYNFHPYFNMEGGPEGHPSTKGNVTIGNDVWIGQDVTIMSGVTIGDGVVVGARSVVASHIPPYSVVAGNPSTIKGFRCTPSMIARLLELQWWNWEDEKIKRNLELLYSPISLETIKKLEEAL